MIIAAEELSLDYSTHVLRAELRKIAKQDGPLAATQRQLVLELADSKILQSPVRKGKKGPRANLLDGLEPMLVKDGFRLKDICKEHGVTAPKPKNRILAEIVVERYIRNTREQMSAKRKKNLIETVERRLAKPPGDNPPPKRRARYTPRKPRD